MLLYDNPESGNCYKVRLLMAQLGLDCERRTLDVVDRSNRPAVLGPLNPGLRIPTLVLDDDRPLAESNAITCYLARGTPLLPEEPYPHAQVLQWMFFEQYSHEPYIAVSRFWRIARIEPPESEIQAKRRGGVAALEALEAHLAEREFLVGEHYSVADIALYAYTHVAPEGGFQLEPYPAVRRWLDRVAAQSGHIPITA